MWRFKKNWNKSKTWCVCEEVKMKGLVSYLILHGDLVVQVDIYILTERITLRQTCGTILDQVKGLERPKRCQELLHLENTERRGEITIEIRGERWEGQGRTVRRGDIVGHLTSQTIGGLSSCLASISVTPVHC